MNTDGLAADVARYNETCHRESMHRPFSPATKNIRSRIDYLNNLSIFYVLLPCQPISSAIFHPIYVPEIDRIIFPLFFLLYLSTRRARINWKISLQPFDRELILTHSVSVHFGESCNLQRKFERIWNQDFKVEKRFVSSTNREKEEEKLFLDSKISFRLNSSKKGIVWRACRVRLNANVSYKPSPPVSLVEIWKERGIFRPRANVSFVPLVTGARVQRPSWALFSCPKAFEFSQIPPPSLLSYA